jgi:hypothetical protein
MVGGPNGGFGYFSESSNPGEFGGYPGHGHPPHHGPPFYDFFPNQTHNGDVMSQFPMSSDRHRPDMVSAGLGDVSSEEGVIMSQNMYTYNEAPIREPPIL